MSGDPFPVATGLRETALSPGELACLAVLLRGDAASAALLDCAVVCRRLLVTIFAQAPRAEPVRAPRERTLDAAELRMIRDLATVSPSSDTLDAQAARLLLTTWLERPL